MCWLKFQGKRPEATSPPNACDTICAGPQVLVLLLYSITVVAVSGILRCTVPWLAEPFVSGLAVSRFTYCCSPPCMMDCWPGRALHYVRASTSAFFIRVNCCQEHASERRATQLDLIPATRLMVVPGLPKTLS